VPEIGNLSIPTGVQKLQKALHVKAKAQAGYRFYALNDKISRDDILAPAYAQCRSKRRAPGEDRQDVADIEEWAPSVAGGTCACALEGEIRARTDEACLHAKSQR